MKPSFEDLKVGDKVLRSICGMSMEMIVIEVREKYLLAAASGTEHWPVDALWMFDRQTGAEEDPDLKWGVEFGRTGSFLKRL
jgi:hypothetical protein